MRITDLLSASRMRLHVAVADKQDALDQLIALTRQDGLLADPDAFRRAVLEREEQVSTAIQEGIAVPHGRGDSVRRTGLAVMTLNRGVDWGAMDGQPSDLLFLIAATEDGAGYMEILSRLMSLLMDREFQRELRSATTPEAFLAAVDKAEQARFGEEKKEADSFRILAVTACPTGIAHTYMAAEALEQAAAHLGVTIKVETRGSGGVQNRLTDEEIAAADGIILAVDRTVDEDRFAGKPVLKVPVADGVHRAEELIQTVLDGQAPVLAAGAKRSSLEPLIRPAGLPRAIYRHLMEGVSHMLPFVIGGGILMALGYLFDDPSLGAATFGQNTPLSAFLTMVGRTSMNLMLPVLSGYIARSLADRPGLMPGFVGGALSANGLTFSTIFDGTATVPSGFVGAVLAGFAAGLFMRGLRRLCDHLPDRMAGIKPTLIYPLAGILFIGVFMCLVDPFVGGFSARLSQMLNDMGGVSRLALGAVLGGMMAVDMGGPVNKAAYVAATGAVATAVATGLPLTSAGYRMMAAVMAGGMVPPLALAFCATCFARLFNQQERRIAPINYLLGLCFITEGAVPFAAADPFRVIPSCVLGGSLAGALSMYWGCTLPAPHGGVFVFPLAGNPAGYVLALVLGTLAGALCLALLRRFWVPRGMRHAHT